MEAINASKAKNKKFKALLKRCIVKTPEVVKHRRLLLVKKGQGEGLTKWKG